MKRVTLEIFDLLTHARYYARILKEAGLDVKVVSKHALQIHPDQVVGAAAILRRVAEEEKLMTWPPTGKSDEEMKTISMDTTTPPASTAESGSPATGEKG